MASSAPRRIDIPDGLPVRLHSFLVTGKGAVLNLSASGAYVTTSMFLLPQARVKLQIVLRDEKRWFDADAIVVWENRGTVGRRDGLPPGYGVRFVDLSAESARVIEAMLAGEYGASPEPEPKPEPTSATLAIDSPMDLLGDEPDGPPYRLHAKGVRARVPAEKPGIYVLSYDRTQEARVGRADGDLREAIVAYEGSYAYFYFEVLGDDEDRFFRECELFHRLGGDRGQLDHSDHPTPPSGASQDCPVCVAENAP